MKTPLLVATSVALTLAATPLLAQNQPGHVYSNRLITEGMNGFGGSLMTTDGFGDASADIGDVDGDGVSDLAIGASASDVGGINSGRVWLLFMNADGTVKSTIPIDNANPTLPFPLAAGDYFGSAVEPAGDLDGNGVPDMWVGARGDDDGESANAFAGPGALYAILLDKSGKVLGSEKISNFTPGLKLGPDSAFGFSIADIGDVFEDGSSDLAVGAPFDDDGGMGRGAVWILDLKPGVVVASAKRFGPGSSSLNPAVVDGASFGVSVEGLGDVDGNGSPDFAVGAFQDDGPGMANGSIWFYFNDDDGPIAIRRVDPSNAAFSPDAPQDNHRIGRSLAAIGDVDGDGHVDLAVGASSGGASSRGAIWTLFLSDDPNDLVDEVTLVDDSNGFLGLSLDPFDFMGTSLAPVGDRDGDGVPDLLVGLSGYDVASSNEGAVALLRLRGPTVTDLGQGLSGNFAPNVVASGSFVAGEFYEVSLGLAEPFGITNLFLGFSELNAPFRGGTMVPAFDVISYNLALNAGGKLTIGGLWPMGIPAGFTTYVQYWMLDPGAPVGVNASNALALVAGE